MDAGIVGQLSVGCDIHDNTHGSVTIHSRPSFQQRRRRGFDQEHIHDPKPFERDHRIAWLRLQIGEQIALGGLRFLLESGDDGISPVFRGSILGV